MSRLLSTTILALCCLGVRPLVAAEARVVENSDHGVWDDAPRKNVHLLEALILGSEDGDDAFGRIADIAVDSRGRWIILDADSSCVKVYHPDSLTMKSFGRKGEGPGEFNRPTALGIDANDRIYVASMGGRIAVFGPHGKLLDEFRHQFPGAIVRGLKITAQGTYIACFDYVDDKLVHRYDAGHSYLSSFADSWSAAVSMPPDEELAWNGGAIDVDANGFVYCTQLTPYEIRKFSPQGELLLTIHRQNNFKPPRVERQGDGATFYSFSASFGVFALPDGKILNVSDYLRPDTNVANARTIVDVYDAEGHLLKSRQLDSHVGIRCLDASGRLYAIEEREVPQVVKYRLVFQ
jgi:hypothetical protein